MASNIDELITNDNVVIQRRIKRYDVNWGRPVNALTYKRLILSADPSYYWKLENSSGSTVNIGYKGTAFNSVYTGTGTTFGTGIVDPLDTCGIFGGTSYGLPGTAAADADATSLTLSAWVYLESNVSTTKAIISRGNDFGAATYPYALTLTNVNAINNEVVLYGNNNTSYSGGGLSLNTWHHIVVTVRPNGSNWYLRIYVDGVEVLSNDTATNLNPQPSNNEKIYLGAYYDAGSLVTGSRFIGRLDEISIFYKALSYDFIKKAYSVGITSSFIEPDEDFDNDVLGVVYDSTDYPTLISQDTPIHYWPCDTTDVTGGPTYKSPDLGTEDTLKRNDLVQTGYCTINTGPSLITGYGNPAGASEPYSNNENNGVWGTSKADSTDNLQLGIEGAFASHSFEFWIKFTNFGDERDGILGFNSARQNGEGYLVYHRDSKLWIDFCAPDPAGIQFNANLNQWGDYVMNGIRIETLGLGAPSGTVGGTGSFVELLKNQIYYVAITIDTQGMATAYLNGNAVATRQLTASRGLLVPSAASRFRVGQPTGTEDSSPFYLDELAMYTRELTPAEILRHYQVGIYGPSYRTNFVNDDPTQPGSPYSLSQNEYSSLENEEDITRYISKYTIEKDLQQLIDTVSMTVFEPWGESTLETKLRANTYVTIEERYTSLDESFDSDWVSKGAYLVEGPLSKSIVGSGGKTYEVSLKGLLKMLTFDLAHTFIEPDKIFVPKRLMDDVTTFPDFKEFHIKHDVVAGEVYRNWAESPAVKLWVTDLQNFNDGDKGGVDDPKEEIRIRGGESAVRVLGGQGALQIDLNFFTDKISENGLGNPSKVYAELYRYADPFDVESSIQITNIYHTDRWYLSTSRLNMFADNKTMFVKSGTAKGKMFRIRQYGSLTDDASSISPGSFLAGSNVALSGSSLGNWTSPGNAVDSSNTTTASINGSVNFSNTQTKTTNYLKFATFTTTNNEINNFSDTASIKGIEVHIRHRTNLGDMSMSSSKRPIRDNILYLSKDGTLAPAILSTNKASLTPWTDLSYSGGPVPADFEEFVYGGELDSWGLDTLTVAELKTIMSTMAVYYSAKSVTDGTGQSGSQNFTIEIESLSIKFYIQDNQRIHIVDMNGLAINPAQEGLAIGDDIQIGDYNAVEDCLRKILIKNGFQENDSSLPFYFELDPCPKSFAPSATPIRNDIEDAVQWIDVAQQLLTDFAPPDYKLFQDSNGVIRAKLIGLSYLAEPSHMLDAIVDLSEDRTDYGIATRVIARGQGGVSVNAALNSDFGGNSACHAYKLNTFATNLKDLNGKVLSQTDANDVWKEVFDGNPQTPIPPGTSWNTGDPSINRYYGVIYNRYGKIEDVKRWDFEDTDLVALDIGKTGTATPIEIDAVEFTWFNHYLEGNSLRQSVSVYYMTEEDYENEYNRPAPSNPDQTDTSYFPTATARSWKLLIDEDKIQLDDGDTTIESSDFESGKPTRLRFLKFRNGQCHYRFPVIGKDDGRAYSRITFADIKVFNSRNIMASAELGVTDPFGTGQYKSLANRLRRRTDILDLNLYLDTYDKAKGFALAQLQERYQDFSPFTTTVWAPHVEVGQVIRVRNPETAVEDNYIIMAMSHEDSGQVKLQLMNFSIKV